MKTKKTTAKTPKPRNFVAKHCALLHKPKAFKDKLKDYSRHPKHKTGKSMVGVSRDD